MMLLFSQRIEPRSGPVMGWQRSVIALRIERIAQTIAKEREPQHDQSMAFTGKMSICGVLMISAGVYWPIRPSVPSSPVAAGFRLRRN